MALQGRKIAPIMYGINTRNARAGCPLLVLFLLSQLNRNIASPKAIIPPANKISMGHKGSYPKYC